MSRRPRDNQRERVYRWERTIKHYHGDPTWKTMDEVTAWAKPIWRKERGRYGHAKVPCPSFESSHWGQTSAIAHDDHRITLPLWARKRTIVLHEMAHRLTPANEAHGPRFVGVLIGLLARHCGMDAEYMKVKADECGVKYDLRSIGAVPNVSLSRRIEQYLPGTDIEIAVNLGYDLNLPVTYKQVRGAALSLIRQGKARFAGKRIVAVHAGELT